MTSKAVARSAGVAYRGDAPSMSSLGRPLAAGGAPFPIVCMFPTSISLQFSTKVYCREAVVIPSALAFSGAVKSLVMKKTPFICTDLNGTTAVFQKGPLQIFNHRKGPVPGRGTGPL